MSKLQAYELEKLRDLAEEYIKSDSKNAETVISGIENLGGQDLVNILNYIKDKYMAPYFREKDILYTEALERIEALEGELKDHDELKEKLKKIKEIHQNLEKNKRELSNLLNAQQPIF